MRTHTNLVVAIIATIFLISSPIAHAAQPLVEVISMPHWPVKAALKPVFEVLIKLGDKIRVIELNTEDAEGKKRMKSVGKRGHIPVLILIDGKYRHQLPNGKKVEFINFPGGASSPMGISGSWTPKDVEAVIFERLK